jgi:putative flippase GtrA
MKVLRDGAHFIVVGGIQLALDSATYIVLTKAGVMLVLANLCGRAVGACCGFWLNGRITFFHRPQPQVHIRLVRYLILWLCLTAISTAALAAVAHHGGLARSWWAKPLIEAALGVTSFLVSRHWVYQR